MGRTIYELTPFRAVIPCRPVFSGPLDVDRLRTSKTFEITAAESVVFQAAAARQEAEMMVADCMRRFRRGDRYALIELLDANPAFILVPWVAEKYFLLLRNGMPLRRPGRVRGKHEFHPLVVVGLVQYLIEAREAKHPHEAFQILRSRRILEYTTARDLFYRGLKEDRFRPVYFEFEHLRRLAPAEEVEPLLSRALSIKPGTKTRAKAMDPALGEVDITFEGL